MQKPTLIFRSVPVAICCLILLAVIAYASIIPNHFTNWDDEHLIVKNRALRSLNPLFILENFHVAYPPLTVFSHGIDYFFWKLNPVGYHLTDLLLYALVVVTLFFIAADLTGNSAAACVAATIFALHPLHVESVTWLSSRKDGLAMLFYLLGFLAYLKSARRDSWRMITVSVLFYFLALWSKPLMVTLPLALLACECILRRDNTGIMNTIFRLSPFIIPIGITVLATIYLDPHNELSLAYHGGGPGATFLLMLRILGDYFRMLFLPLRLSALYIVTLPEGLWEIPSLFRLFALLALPAFAVTRARRAPLITFCIAWAFLSLLPVMQIIPINVVKADRYLYLPSAAFCIMFGAFSTMFHSPGKRLCATVTIAALAVPLLLLTLERNIMWRTSVTLWESETENGPESADAYNNLGIAYCREERYRDAEKAIQHALELRPGFASAHNNLANVYRYTGRTDEALRELRHAAGLTRDIVYAANAHITMGLIYEEKQQYEKALEAYHTALTLQPVYLDDSLLRARISFCREQLTP